MNNEQKFDDIFVAVHGIGKQRRSETVRSVANRLADSETLRKGGHGWPVAPQPLGYFYSDVKDISAARLLDDFDNLAGMDLQKIGFCEVFWADIPQDVVKEGRTLEETKAWARTVVARARALYQHSRELHKKELIPPDFEVAGEVLDEIITAVYVFENLVFLAKKAGIMKFELREVLEEYLGDIQLVTEFSYYRADVIGRFHHTMEKIYEAECKRDNPNVRIHIVAHSEGTVVSFLGLLRAMCLQRFTPADPEHKKTAGQSPYSSFPEWLKHVHGFMTIGSPIDKHVLLWQRLWDDLDFKQANSFFKQHRIQWRNYYDYGDPVGFMLDSARLWLKDKECEAFEFSGRKGSGHDNGFARYLFPGEAHNEYWNDPAVFEHFIKDVVKPTATRPKPPGSRPLVYILSPTLPYLVSFIVLFAGVFILFKAIHAYTYPGFDPLQKVFRFTQFGVQPQAEPAGKMLRSIFGVAGLIVGVTLLARIPRLASGEGRVTIKPVWMLASLLGFAAGCGLYLLVPNDVRWELGKRIPYLGNNQPTLTVMALAAVAGLLGFLATSPKVGKVDRRQRIIARGTRPLIIGGGIIVAIIIILQLCFPPRVDPHFNKWDDRSTNYTPADITLINQARQKLGDDDVKLIQEAHLTPPEVNQAIVNNGTNWLVTLRKVEPVLATNSPVWRVVLAGAAFLYLWWLAILLFDLSFVWQRYIRNAVTNKRLKQWASHRWKRTSEKTGG